MIRCIEFNHETEYVQDFIDLPKRLYSKTKNMENPQTTKQLLLGTHPLSKYFELQKFVVYDDDKLVGRFALTFYPKDKTAYLGFYESIEEPDVAKSIFECVIKAAKQRKCLKVIGPVDASFWIKYRMKINKFDVRPYTDEPYNKDYYFDQFKANGFKVCEHYTSNQYKIAEYEYINKEYAGMYDKFMKKGYEIRNLDMSRYDESISELYDLLTALYSDFPIYKDLSREDFLRTFADFKQIINPAMVKIGYKNGKMAGFFISVPNYSNLVYHPSLLNIGKILHLRRHPKGYVMLYMGVLPEHHGLGRALVYSIIQELNRNKLPSIGALARDGKVTQNYAADMIEDKYEYVLLERKIK